MLQDSKVSCGAAIATIVICEDDVWGNSGKSLACKAYLFQWHEIDAETECIAGYVAAHMIPG